MNKFAGCATCTNNPKTPKTPHVGNVKRSRYPGQNTQMAGFSYVEVLVATVLIAVVLVPAMDSLVPAVTGSGIHETYTEDRYQLIALFEEVLAEPLTDLDAAATAAGNPDTATSYSDIFTYGNGRQITRNVFLSRYDGDNADSDNDPFTGIDEGLLWVRVEIANTTLSIESLSSE